MQGSVSKLAVEEVYTYIVLFAYEHQYIPSYEKIGKELHRSSEVVNRAINELARRGLIEMEEGNSRSIKIKALEMCFVNHADAERLGIKNARCRNK